MDDPNGPPFKRSRPPLHVAAKNGYIDLIEVLTRHGANVTAGDEFGRTAPHRAVLSPTAGKARVPELLIELGVDPNLCDNDRVTALAEVPRQVGSLSGPPIGNESQASADRRTESSPSTSAGWHRCSGGSPLGLAC